MNYKITNSDLLKVKIEEERELTAEERQKCLSFSIRVMLTSIFRSSKKLDKLQYLHELVDQNNKKLKQVHYSRNIEMGSLNDIVLHDIITVIALYIPSKPEWLGEYYKLFKDDFADIILAVDELRADEADKNLFYIYEKKYSGIAERGFYGFCIYYFDDLCNKYGIITAKNDLEGEMQAEMNTSQYLYHDFFTNTFTDSEDIIRESATFKKYIKKQRIRISEQLNINENQISSTINSNLRKIGIESHKNGFGLNDFTEAQARLFGGYILAKEGRSDFAFDLVLNDWVIEEGNEHLKSVKWKGYNYTIDVDGIIEFYYMMKAIKKYMECCDNQQPFSKLTLARETSLDPIEYDIEQIYNICVSDCIAKLSTCWMDEYYDHFSWETFTGKKIVNQYTELLNSKDEINASLIAKVRDLTQIIQQLRQVDRNQKEMHNYDVISIERQFEKLVSQKDEEIEFLKRKLRIQEEYIELINSKSDEEVDNEPDLTALQDKKYLFVGHIDGRLPELKHLFPNSSFVSEKTQFVSMKNTDYVVFLIPYMSHALFYKIKEHSDYDSKKAIYCNGCSMNSILNDICDGL